MNNGRTSARSVFTCNIGANEIWFVVTGVEFKLFCVLASRTSGLKIYWYGSKLLIK